MNVLLLGRKVRIVNIQLLLNMSLRCKISKYFYCGEQSQWADPIDLCMSLRGHQIQYLSVITDLCPSIFKKNPQKIGKLVDAHQISCPPNQRTVWCL